MKQKKVLKNELEAISGEFKAIKSIDMSCKAKSVLEKVMWAIVGIIGVIWVIYFIIEIIKDHNPKIAWVKDTNIRELKYPAISICSETTTKIDVAERIGNYFNGDLEIVDEWKELRRKLLEKSVLFRGFSYSKKCPWNKPEKQRATYCKVCNFLGNVTIKMNPCNNIFFSFDKFLRLN